MKGDGLLDIYKFSLRIVVLLLLVCILGSCASAWRTERLLGYEILNIPASSLIYSPGKLWKRGIGPVRDRETEARVVSGHGPANLTISEKSLFEANLKLAISKWISSVFGVSSENIRNLSFDDLVFSQIVDPFSVSATGDIIYGTIEAKSIVIQLLERPEVRSSVDSGKTPNIELSLTNSHENTFSVRAQDGSRLVVAIKVVNLTSEILYQKEMPMRAGRVGSEVELGLGYRIQLMDMPDPVQKSARVRIGNSQLPRFTGKTTEISADRPWVNRARVPTGRQDEEEVWDMVEMRWSGTTIELSLTRQSVAIHLSETGLGD